MNEKLNKILMNVKHLFDSDEITRKLEKIRAEYKRSIEPELDIQTGFGHVFSKSGFMSFEKAVKRNKNNQDGDFHQYIKKLMSEKNMTQSTLSELSWIKESNLSRYINGSRVAPEHMLFRIALALKLDLIETETLLRKVGKGFRRTFMDGTVITAIEEGEYEVTKVDALLQTITQGSESLFTKKEQEEYEMSYDDLDIEFI